MCIHISRIVRNKGNYPLLPGLEASTLMYKCVKVDTRSIQQTLGHISIATTEIYTHINENQLQSAVNSNPLVTMVNH